MWRPHYGIGMSQKRRVEEPPTDAVLDAVETFLHNSESNQRRLLYLIDREIAKGGIYAEVPEIMLGWYMSDPRSRARIAELKNTQDTVRSRASRRREIQLEKKRQRRQQ